MSKKKVNYISNTRRDDTKILVSIIVAFLLVAWFCSPPGNKFLQICFWGNNVKYAIAKIVKPSSTNEYLHHRNNAVYLAKMYPTKDEALKEMNKAIDALPKYAPDDELKSLYKDRAEIKLYKGDKKGALDDFIKSGQIYFNDYLKVAMLFKSLGKYREAMSYCNSILNQDGSAYAGFACIADIYNSVDRPDLALKAWDLAIDRNSGNPRAYVDRAKIKKAMGDFAGYNDDIKIAKNYSPNIDIEASIIEETLEPKILALNIR